MVKQMNNIEIKQIKSASGKGSKQYATLKGLGLGKIGRVSILRNTNSIQGMINKVSHLIDVKQ